MNRMHIASLLTILAVGLTALSLFVLSWQLVSTQKELVHVKSLQWEGTKEYYRSAFLYEDLAICGGKLEWFMSAYEKASREALECQQELISMMRRNDFP